MTRSQEFSLAALMARFREFDRREFLAMVPPGDTPFNHLVNTVNDTELSWALTVDGRWHGIGGVGWNDQAGAGCPWLLLSDTLPTKHRHAFRRITRRINDIFFEHYAPLVNYVHAESSSHRWLEWLGYDVRREREFDFKGEPFYLFTYGF